MAILRKTSLFFFSASLFLLALATAQVMAEPGRMDEEKETEGYLFDSEDRQMDRMRARIFSRKGLTGRSIRAYETLRKVYPDDEEIWVDYIDILVDNRRYDQARHELEKLFKKNPDNFRGQRISARIYEELKQYEWAYPVYEEMLENRPYEAALWSGYAYTRQSAGDWGSALHYFSRVLEIDPEKEDARRSLRAILKAHRPQIETGLRRYRLLDSDSVIDTYTINYFRQLKTNLAFHFNYDQVQITRPQRDTGDGFQHLVHDTTFSLEYHLNRHWLVSAGAGRYSGLGSAQSYHTGIHYQPRPNISIRANYELGRPWYDPLEASNYDGQLNCFQLNYYWNINQNWGLLFQFEQWAYYLSRDNEYGRRRDGLLGVTRRLWTNPDVALSYSFYRSKFGYRDVHYRPVSMAEAEGIHSFGFRFEHKPHHRLGYGLSGALRRDELRNIDSWSLWPEIRLGLGNRIELRLDYRYVHERGPGSEGNTGTLQAYLNFIL